MDPELRKGLESFKKRSHASITSANAKQLKETGSPSQSGQIQRPTKKRTLPPQLLQKFTGFRTQNKSKSDSDAKGNKGKGRFSLLAQVVVFLKEKYLSNTHTSFTIEEILDQSGNLDVSHQDKLWLISQALPNNSKVSISQNGTFKYKPLYDVTNKESLLNLLKKLHESGKGGILLDDLRESLPRADEIVRSLKNYIAHFTRSSDKKDVIYFYDSSLDFAMDDEILRSWKSVSVDGQDELAIESYLKISSLPYIPSSISYRKSSSLVNPKKAKSKRKPAKKLNVHLSSDLLQDYSNSILQPQFKR